MAEIEDVMGLISALRAEVEQKSVTPDRVGYLLEQIVGLLDGYADVVTVGAIRQDVDRALRETAALALENAEQSDALSSLRASVNRISNAVQVNGVRIEELSNRNVANTTRIQALESAMAELGEVYLTESEYNSLVERGQVRSDVKYFIWES